MVISLVLPSRRGLNRFPLQKVRNEGDVPSFQQTQQVKGNTHRKQKSSRSQVEQKRVALLLGRRPDTTPLFATVAGAF